VAIAIRGTTPATTTSTGNPISLTLTGARQPSAGDVLLIIHSNDFYAATNMPTPTVGGSTSGVNAVSGGSADAGTNHAHIKAYTFNVGSTGDLTVSVTETGSADEDKGLTVYVLSGVDTATPVDAAAGNFNTSATTVHDAPSVSPTSSDAFLVCHDNSGGGSSTPSYTPPSGMTEQYDSQVGGFSMTGATLQLSSSGATGTKTFTPAGSVEYGTVSIALKTASGGGSAATPGPLVVTPSAAGVTGRSTLVRSSLTDPPSPPPQPIVVVAPRPGPAGFRSLLRATAADDPALVTSNPIVVAQQPKSRPGVVALLRGSLVDDVVVPSAATPGPIMVAVQPKPPAGMALLVRGSLSDEPLQPTQPLIVTTQPRPRPGAVWLGRSVTDDEPGSQPTMLVAARPRPGGAAILLRSLSGDSAAPPPNPIVVAVQPPRRTGVALLITAPVPGGAAPPAQAGRLASAVVGAGNSSTTTSAGLTSATTSAGMVSST
jgi:hypothetical protein